VEATRRVNVTLTQLNVSVSLAKLVRTVLVSSVTRNVVSTAPVILTWDLAFVSSTGTEYRVRTSYALVIVVPKKSLGSVTPPRENVNAFQEGKAKVVG